MNKIEKCYNFEKKLFKIPLHDGSFGFIYIFNYEEKIHAFLCGLFDEKNNLTKNHLIACFWTTPENFLKKRWLEVAKFEMDLPKTMKEKKSRLEEKGFIGTSIYGGANIWKFCQSFFGLEPWNQFYDSDYFDQLLLDLKYKPKNLIYENK